MILHNYVNVEDGDIRHYIRNYPNIYAICYNESTKKAF